MKDHPTIKVVDPCKMRKSGDTDFSDFQTHLSNKIIPKNEIWINAKLKREDHHVAMAIATQEWKDMRDGITLDKSLDRQRVLETNLRKKNKDHNLDIEDFPNKLIPDIKNEGNIPAFLVNGEAVRNIYTTSKDNPFEQGGHDLRYPYVAAWAKKEGLEGAHWIDRNGLCKEDYTPTLEHEIDERNKMSKGMKYEAAHKIATKDEKKTRSKQ